MGSTTTPPRRERSQTPSTPASTTVEIGFSPEFTKSNMTTTSPACGPSRATWRCVRELTAANHHPHTVDKTTTTPHAAVAIPLQPACAAPPRRHPPYAPPRSRTSTVPHGPDQGHHHHACTLTRAYNPDPRHDDNRTHASPQHRPNPPSAQETTNTGCGQKPEISHAQALLGETLVVALDESVAVALGPALLLRRYS